MDNEETMEKHTHELVWSNIERTIYCKDELCSFSLDAVDILSIVESHDFLLGEIDRSVNILRRITKSTPHSMCSDAEAWSKAESFIAIHE